MCDVMMKFGLEWGLGKWIYRVSQVLRRAISVIIGDGGWREALGG